MVIDYSDKSTSITKKQVSVPKSADFFQSIRKVHFKNLEVMLQMLTVIFNIFFSSQIFTEK